MSQHISESSTEAKLKDYSDRQLKRLKRWAEEMEDVVSNHYWRGAYHKLAEGASELLACRERATMQPKRASRNH